MSVAGELLVGVKEAVETRLIFLEEQNLQFEVFVLHEKWAEFV